MDPVPAPDPDLDPTPDPTSFVTDLKDTKIFFFSSYFFLLTCPQAHHLQSKKFNFLLNFVLKFYFVDIISVHSTHL
jgi:hypothetical protein